MKSVLIFLILTYKGFLSPILKQILGTKSTCRFSPSCSTYAIIKIKEQGALKGTISSFIRFLSCQPFFN